MVPEEVTIKNMHEKQSKFYLCLALIVIFISTIIILTVLFLFKFWINTIITFIIILVAYGTFQFINRIYMYKVTLIRTDYIQNTFPIKEEITKEQYNLIISDLDYIFEKKKGVVENSNKKGVSHNQDNLDTFYNKLKMNISVRDIEKLNKIYSKDFVDLTKIKIR